MNEKNVYLHHFLLSHEFFQYGRKCGESVCHIRKVSEKSIDLASPVLFEERRDIVDLQSPLRCDTPNLSFISPLSFSGTSCSTSTQWN